jgi:nitrile hydratase accessory protein
LRLPELDAALAGQAVLPPDRPGPVFREPWHAEAFAMAVALHEQGHFTWPEWARALGCELATAPAAGDPEDAYYAAWLIALERLLAAKGLMAEAELRRYAVAWDRAARATPHGQPIVLEAGLRSARRGSA